MATIYAAESTEPPRPIDPGAEAVNQVAGLGEAAFDGVRALINPSMQTFEVQGGDDSALKAAVQTTFTPLSALSFMILLLLLQLMSGGVWCDGQRDWPQIRHGFMVYSFVIG